MVDAGSDVSERRTASLFSETIVDAEVAGKKGMCCLCGKVGENAVNFPI
jgi:hypothetical protein